MKRASAAWAHYIAATRVAGTPPVRRRSSQTSWPSLRPPRPLIGREMWSPNASWLSMRSKTFWGTPPKTRKCRRWSLLRFWSLGLFLADLADLGALLHAVFANQAGHIVLGDAEGFGLGPGNGVNLLPVLLGGHTFKAFTEHAAEAAVGGSGQALGDFQVGRRHGNGYGFGGSHL